MVYTQAHVNAFIIQKVEMECKKVINQNHLWTDKQEGNKYPTASICVSHPPRFLLLNNPSQVRVPTVWSNPESQVPEKLTDNKQHERRDYPRRDH